MSEAKSTIVAIGNPGAGKSTLGNLLAGKIVFKAGLSIDGKGITTKCKDHDVSEKCGFVDTAGIAERDPALREAASATLTAALKKDQNVKMLFFITLQAGRVVAQDVETMSLTLEAVEKDLTENCYGVVVNKVPHVLLKKWAKNPDAKAAVIASLRAAMPPEKTTLHILFNPFVEALDCEDDPIVPENQVFVDFIGVVPMLKIIAEHVEHIVHDHQKLEAMAELIKEREKQILENKEEMARLKAMEPPGLFEQVVKAVVAVAPVVAGVVLGPAGIAAGAAAGVALSALMKEQDGSRNSPVAADTALAGPVAD